VASWGTNNQRKTDEWELKEKQNNDDWELKELQKREEYDFEAEMLQEDAERAATSYQELIFDALENRGKPVGAFRSQYARNEGFLRDHSIKNLKLFLTREGVTDEGVLEDVDASLRNEDHNLKDSTKAALEEKLGLVRPRVVPLDPLPLYEPLPKPEPEPSPTFDPHPELNILEVPPLLEELKAVIMLPYNGHTLEGLNLTQHAWDAAGINPQEVHGSLREDVIPLADKHLLVKVVGKSESESGNLNLVKIMSNAPSVLRPYLQSAAEVAYDAHILAGMIYEEVKNYFEKDVEGQRIVNRVSVEKRPFFRRAIVEEMIGRKSSLTHIMFPNLFGLIKVESEPHKAKYFRENLRTVDGKPLSPNQDWYATHVTQSELDHYKTVAKDVVPKIMEAFDSVQYSAISYDGKTRKNITDLGEIIDTVRDLIYAVPREFFELMEAYENRGYTNDVRERVARAAKDRSYISPPQQLVFNMRLEVGERYEAQVPELTTVLGKFIMKDVNRWKTQFDSPAMALAVFKYDIGTNLDNPAYVENGP